MYSTLLLLLLVIILIYILYVDALHVFILTLNLLRKAAACLN